MLGTGSYAPERVLTNAEIEKIVDTSDEWITSRTGIKERRIAAEGEHTSDIAAAAGFAALQQAGIARGDVDLILVATASPDMFFPATACLVQRKLGARKAACMDISAACSGFLYALELAKNMVATGAISDGAWSSGRRSSARGWIGRTATPACSSATAAGPACWASRPDGPPGAAS